MVLNIYISTLNFFLMLPFSLLLVIFPCLSYLDMLMRFTTTTDPYSMIQNCESTVLLSVVGYGYVWQLLW